MLTIRDYDNVEHALLATKKHNIELNGQEDLELTVHQQKNNDLDLLTIDKLWTVNFNNKDFKIVYIKKITKGSSFYLDIRAIPLFYWDMDKQIIHENHDGSHSANEAFRIVFENSGYQFVLVDFSPSVRMEGFGKGETRLERFKTLLDRYNYEFEIQGSTVYMRHLVGADTNFVYKYRLNASNVSETTEAGSYFTHIKGFGNFDEGEEDYLKNAKIKREYTHPLADVLGKWEGKPIVDGRVTQRDTLDEMMHRAVEDSLEISVEGDLHDIRKMGYTIAVPLKGDRIYLQDERLNMDKEIRVNAVTTTYDASLQSNIIGCEVTFGSQSIRKRHKADLNSLSKNFKDLLLGHLKLPIISLEKIGMDMIKSIHDATSEIVFGDFGMMAISKTNPNNVFGVNSEGWYISQDGGRTPRTIATANGIYADALFAGTLWLTNDMNIEGQTGYLNITGERFVMRSKNNDNNAVEITPEGMTIHGFDGREFVVDGIMRGSRMANINHFYNGSIVSFSGRNLTWQNYSMQRVYYIDDLYNGRYLDLLTGTALSERSFSNSAYAIVRVRAFGDSSAEITRERFMIYRSNQTGNTMDFRRIRLDLQSFYDSIPDYRTIQFYVEVQLDTDYEDNEIIFRINRGDFYR